MDQIKLFLVDDDLEMRESLQHYLSKAGCNVTCFAGGEPALNELEQRQPDVLVTDLRMPRMSGMELLKKVTERYPLLPVSIISAHGDVPMAVEAMQLGAYSFIEKPFEPSRLLTIIRNAAKTHRLSNANMRLRARLSEVAGLDRVLLGDTQVMRSLRSEILNVADSVASVLITGETGTGKEVIARSLHDLSRRSSAPFVAVNCAAISESLFESSMFGHKAGAFTGANKARIGYFEAANNGTLFLDEIGACSVEHQAKLLRAIEQLEITPLGATTPVKVNVRLVSATNENLSMAIQNREFREDLLYRLNTVEISISPLRERSLDIPMLFTHFLALHANTYEAEVPEVSSEDIAVLMAHDWPGNVRELRHVAERRLLAARRGRGSVRESMARSNEQHDGIDSLKDALAAYEKTLIENSLRLNSGRMDTVAEALGIGRRTLNEKLVKFGIERGRFI